MSNDESLRRADELLSDLIETVETARAVPMSSSCVLPRERLLDLLDELREVLPPEMDEARTVIARSSISSAGRMRLWIGTLCCASARATSGKSRLIRMSLVPNMAVALSSRSGGIDGRPIVEYSRSNRGDRRARAASVMRRIGRSG